MKKLFKTARGAISFAKKNNWHGIHKPGHICGPVFVSDDNPRSSRTEVSSGWVYWTSRDAFDIKNGAGYLLLPDGKEIDVANNWNNGLCLSDILV